MISALTSPGVRDIDDHVPSEHRSWSTTVVDVTGDIGQYISIAVDAVNKAHISYSVVTNRALKYATNAYSAWQSFTIDYNGWVGQYTGIALDSNGKAHVSYYDA